MAFDRGAGELVHSQNAASHILSRTADRLQIIFQIDHQDLRQRVRDLDSQ